MMFFQTEDIKFDFTITVDKVTCTRFFGCAFTMFITLLCICITGFSLIEIKMGFSFRSHYLLSQIHQYLDKLIVLCLKPPSSCIWNVEACLV